MLVAIQKEMLQTLQAQKSELIQIQKEMLQALKAVMKCCRPFNCKNARGNVERP
jgi:glycyl-tRNA synthetase alpha subunit